MYQLCKTIQDWRVKQVITFTTMCQKGVKKEQNCAKLRKPSCILTLRIVQNQTRNPVRYVGISHQTVLVGIATLWQKSPKSPNVQISHLCLYAFVSQNKFGWYGIY